MSLYIRRVINSWSKICQSSIIILHTNTRHISFIPVRVPVRVPTKKMSHMFLRFFKKIPKAKKNQMSKTKANTVRTPL